MSKGENVCVYVAKIRKLLSHQFVSHASLKHNLIGLLFHVHFRLILILHFKAVPLLSLICSLNIAYICRKPAVWGVTEVAINEAHGAEMKGLIRCIM